MANISKEEMQKRIESLPEEVQDLLYSPGMYTIIKQISSKNQLHIDQMDQLETETSQVLLGITDTSQFAKVIAQSLQIESTKAEAIAKDVNELLFSKIRNAMKTTDKKATTAPAVPMSQPAAVKAPPVVDQKSVVMPSSVSATTTATPAPITPAPVSIIEKIKMPVPSVTLVAPPSITTPVTTPAVKPAMHDADVMFNEPTVSLPKKVETMAPVAPTIPVATTPIAPSTSSGQAKPPAPAPIYKADPYREPIE